MRKDKTDKTLIEARAEIERLRKWLEWIAVDDTDAQAALRGYPARTTDDTP